MIGTHVHLIRSLKKFQPQNVFEIGSRDGKDAVFYADEFGIAHQYVHAFEPNPALAEYIRNQYPHIQVRQEAISNYDGHSEFNCAIINEQSHESDWMYYGLSSLHDRAEYNTSSDGVMFQKIRVQVRKMSTVLKELAIHSIDICKVDTEGNSFAVLESFGQYIEKVKTFHIEMEYRPYWKGQVLAPTIKNFLEKNNFTLITENFIGNSDQSDSIWVHNNYL
jgi:FkbM family methyltransferase